jgi:hypothetical protein
LPVDIDKLCKVHHLTLLEMFKITEKQYNKYLSILCFDIDDLENKNEILSLKPDIKTYDVIIENCIIDDNFKQEVINGLKLFLKEDVNLMIDKARNIAFFYIGDLFDNRMIKADNYERIKEILKIQNCLPMAKKPKKMSKKAKEIADLQREARETINRIKGKTGGTLNFSDLISAFCSYSKNINILNVWEMTIFQFDNQFKRMQIVNDYEIGIQSLLHGADSKKVNIKHFISKLE